jgi:transposase, IS605 OrfB family, central region
MKLVVNLKLKPDAEQTRALRDTLERCNAACNWLSEQAFKSEIFGQYALHQKYYREIRERFGLTAQAAVRCIAKVADAYKLKNRREVQRKFRKWCAQPYDDRILRLTKDDQINIWTASGRQNIQFICGKYQRRLLPHRKGEVDLMFVRGNWYVACVVDIDEPELIPPQGVLGVDLGIVNIATDSTGESFSGTQLEAKRAKAAKHRRALQRTRTRAARKHLRRLRGKQRRFQSWVNHTISKAIVSKAERYGLEIGLEDLKHIRARVKANKEQRKRLHNWPFGQLRSFIEYKARRSGIPVTVVDPKNTSKTCLACGHIDKANRLEQSVFACVDCGYEANADYVGAVNIGSRANVNLPIFASHSIHVAAESPRLWPKPTPLWGRVVYCQYPR